MNLPRASRGHLLLAGNYHPDDTTPAGGRLRAWNVLTGVPIPVSAEGQFSPLIRGKSFVLLRLERE